MHGLAVLRLGYLVDLLQEQEAICGREIPPELGLLPHDEGDLPAELVVTLPGTVAQNAGVTGGGMDDPGQHLDERRLARPVGSDEADDLTLVHPQTDLADRLLGQLLAVHERLDRAPQAGLLLVDPKGLRELLYFDHDGRRPL